MLNAKTKVVVAMSGGVDSSLTAALLVQEGYEVIGVTMQLWTEDVPVDDPNHRGCCSLSEVEDARRVAQTLGIPHYVMNFRDDFHHLVVEYFIREYTAGRTPNPCIACNRHIKFERLLTKAAALGADYVATGHYARVIKDEQSGRVLLCKGVDTTKDQSYVLYHLNQQTLQKFLFPLGGMEKTKTRELARQFNLVVANKPESQEICFIPDDDYKRFLREHAPQSLRPGDIVTQDGQVLGRHEGLPFYTIGQRKGLGIAAAHPLYVVEIDAAHNRVVVGPPEAVYASELLADDLNWIAIDDLEKPLQVHAKIRYAAHEAPAMVFPEANGMVRVKFEQPQRAITPGQSVVFYHGEKVVGGGVIRKACL